MDRKDKELLEDTFVNRLSVPLGYLANELVRIGLALRDIAALLEESLHRMEGKEDGENIQAKNSD